MEELFFSFRTRTEKKVTLVIFTLPGQCLFIFKLTLFSVQINFVQVKVCWLADNAIFKLRTPEITLICLHSLNSYSFPVTDAGLVKLLHCGGNVESDLS